MSSLLTIKKILNNYVLNEDGGDEMKNGKSNQGISVMYFLAAFCFYVCSIMNFLNDGSLGGLYLCLGSMFLCLGATWAKK